jgi:putative peptidoglycan lipid II flippase
VSEFKDKEEQPELVVPSAVNLNAEEEADEQASLALGAETGSEFDSEAETGPESKSATRSESVPSSETPETNQKAPKAGGKKASLGKSFGLVAILTVISKLAGLVRDIIIAGVYGAGVLADAYNIAYLFTGNVLILFGGLGGPFHSATVATLNPRKDDPKSGVFITQVMVATGFVLLIVAGLVCIAAPYLVQMLAGDYGTTPQVHELFTSQTIYQIRVMSPLIVIAGLIGVTYGILNVYNKLFWPSLSPSIASLAIVVVLICFPDPNSSVPLAVGTLIGAFGQLFAQLPGMFQCNLRFRFSMKPAEGLREYMSILWPAIIGTSIGQLTVYVDSFFCTKMEPGSWTAISNANRLIQLPLGVLITAMLVPILPRFSDLATANKPDGVKHEFRRALNFLWFLSMPLTMILCVIPKPLVTALYQRVNWHTRDTELVVTALLFLAPSIVIYIGRDLITRVFYAYKDSKSPYYIGMAAIVLKGLLDFYFVMQLHMGVGGISLATTLITVFNFSCLAFLLRRKIGSLGVTKLFKPFFIMLSASTLAGIATYYIYQFVDPLIQIKGALHLIGLLSVIAIASGIGLMLYAAICLLCKLEEPYMLLRRVKLLPPQSEG